MSPATAFDELETPNSETEEDYLSTSMGLMARDLYRAINRAIDERVARFGLAAHTCRYLAIMHDRDGVTPKELSDYLSVRSPTTLAALRTLEEKRLVKRSRDADDGRKSVYRLTARGKEVEALVRESALEVERAAVSSLTPDQIAAFRDTVRLIRKALDFSLGDPGQSSDID
ncbi:MarR family winged helix-turn-helix transcriptional regulator [Novosphingobium sp. RL4]|uniref:MarR family winged helix-turn-helix transcriptional regulator n=1 Tax=Novosphingobium sp. RL4 TaxID=3109595 RepID=UPI002D7952FF|nr:MarR family transcriptional regulator [Novosphingobium sp. RL4]WRT94417.1 MarR family transcriptional regulator [Novosphingobium sp. RL4]